VGGHSSRYPLYNYMPVQKNKIINKKACILTYNYEAILLLQGENPTLCTIQLRVVARELSGAAFALAFLFETIERGGRVQSCLFFLKIETGGGALGYCEIHFGLIGGWRQIKINNYNKMFSQFIEKMTEVQRTKTQQLLKENATLE